ncbi:hypothetical protein MPLSOD_310019 [Mesorhizobium sp. SOD10]|nr:hypothetical protein MPLSOD_310019 [Mesorhizobium sp. SOD10]
MAIGETVDDSAPLPVSIQGEDAGKQVRGGACAGWIRHELALRPALKPRAIQLPKPALPLIPLLGPSPRIVTGRRG